MADLVFIGYSFWAKIMRMLSVIERKHETNQIMLRVSFSVFIFSQILTEYVTIETEGVCMYVRASVCLSVCVSATAQTAQPILMKICTNDL